MLWHIKFNIDGVLGRIDTIKTVAAAFEDFDTTIKTLNSILKDSKIIYSMFSEVSSELLNSYNDIRDTIIAPEADLSFLFIPTEDAMEILRDIERKVGEELSRKFPNVPVHLDKVLDEDIEQGIARLYSSIATDGGTSTTTLKTPQPKKEDIGSIRVKVNIGLVRQVDPRDLSKIERMTLNYLLRMGRRSGVATVNIYGVARLFRVTPLQVLDSLYSLCEANLISFL